jgi:hypothetical protein
MHPIILAGQSQRDYAKRCIDMAEPMSVVSIKDPTRTNLQNALMWGLIADIMEHPSNERPDWSAKTWKCALMMLCGHEIKWDKGLGNSGPFPIEFSSSVLTIPQMSDLINAIYAYGAERGVVFKEPKEQST